MPDPKYLFLAICFITGVTSVACGTTITKHVINPGDVIGDSSYSDTLMTNGGILAINKNVDFDSQNQTESGYNLQTEKIMTYSGIQGSHMLGEESYILDITGSYTPDESRNIRCIYASEENMWLPAFCNVVQAKASLININTAQISQKGSLRMVGSEHIPAELNYQFAVSPDSASTSFQAEGTVKTEFAGSILEARDNSSNVSVTNQWKDTTEVSGGMTEFQKNFRYQSGLRL